MHKDKKPILDDALNEVVEESWGGGGSLFGGAPGGGSGTFTYAQNAGPNLWAPGSPPYRSTTGSPGGLNVKDIGAESEEYAKAAGLNKMFPLDRLETEVADAYLNLHNIESILDSCLQYNKVLTDQKEKKALLEQLIKRIQQLQRMLKEASEDIDRLTVSNT